MISLDLPLALSESELKSLLGDVENHFWRSEFFKVSAMLHPRGGYEILPVERTSSGSFSIGNRLVESLDLSRHLAGCEFVVALAATVGPEIDRRISEGFAAGENQKAFVLDAIASAAVEGVIDALCDFIRQRHGPISSRFSPGYGDWSVQGNEIFKEILDLDTLGISVLPSGALLPRKTVTALAGVLKSSEAEKKTRNCQTCPVENCRFPCRFRSNQNE